MKAFLFVYPVKEYLKYTCQGFPKQTVELTLNRLQSILDQRYRRRGYQIYWLAFAVSKTNRMRPVRLNFFLKPRPEDKIISAGITWNEMRRWQYAKPSTILKQLPEVSELRIGGFHQGDCVERIAKAAHRCGVKTFVDEDTTDSVFSYSFLSGKVPPIRRTRQEYAVFFRELLINKNPLGSKIAMFALKEHRRHRQNKPWLVQL